MNDAEFERLVRDSNPATTPLDAPLTLRQRAVMERIVAGSPAQARSRRMLAFLVTAPVAAVLAILVLTVAVLNPLGTSPAAAFGPVPLAFQPTNRTAEEVVEVAKRQLRPRGGGSEPEREAAPTAWNLAINEDGEAQRTLVISPSVTELRWAEDLSGTLVVRVGEPFLADGSDTPVPTDGTVEPGTVLDDRRFEPGEYPAQIPDPDELRPDRIGSLLSLLAPDTKHPGDAFLAMHTFLNEWTLTDEQHSALIGALLEYEDITVRGSALDRLGREVIGLDGISSRPGQRATLLISAATGRIVGVETTVVEGNDSLPVPAGTVISYTLWKDNK